jgi:hypothetical protein
LEYRRFPLGESPVSTFEFHEHRERAPHLEQGIHQGRLRTAAILVHKFSVGPEGRGLNTLITDLGCGDGGLLSLLRDTGYTHTHGYDFQPSNVEGWLERGVLLDCIRLNFIEEWNDVVRSDVYVMTEVLEHLEDPHGMLRQIRERDAGVVCSSPWMEHEGNIDGCHNWAWDMPGYTKMITDAGFEVLESVREGIFQVHLAVPR